MAKKSKDEFLHSDQRSEKSEESKLQGVRRCRSHRHQLLIMTGN